MPKKVLTQSNTLFKYFQSSNENASPTPLQCSQTMDVEDDAEDMKGKIQSASKKRLRVIDSDSDSESSEPPSKPSSSTSNQSKFIKKSTSTSDSNNLIKKFKKESSPRDNLSIDDAKPSTSKKSENETEVKAKTHWLHDELEFLKPNNIRDAQKRKTDRPDYDPRTLYVPESYLNGLTPAMRQWWILKSKHFDTVLFFKVGKFYELYHMDAVIGVNHLGFTFMKGEFAHSGFPEIAYGRMAQTLMEQGFKIARVEQTETPEMMNERCKTKHSSKFDKVVNREICQISTKGCCVFGPQIGDEENPLPVYMLAIAEKEQDDHNIKYGICFVDTSIGVFHVAEFFDDRHCSKLLILLSEHPPTLVLTDRNRTSNTTYEILRKNAGCARVEKLVSPFDSNNIDGLLQKFREASYFKDKNGEFCWPNILCDLISNDTCEPGNELTLCALGICWGYLRDSLLDIQVFTMGQFVKYEPFVHVEVKTEKEYMILDAITMENLNLLGATGTLQKTLDLCCTPFGKRLLQQWICHPLCNIEKINGRQQAIKELYSNNEWLNAARDILRKLPDLDRQIMKINTFGNRQFAEEHPDSRAVLYEARTYFKRKILILLNTLKGFEIATEILDIFKGCESRLLRKITQTPDGLFCDLTEPLQYFQKAFDHKEAENQGKIVPQIGIDADYDNAEAIIKEINEELDHYLEEQTQFFGCTVRYFGNDKKRYQLEVPENTSHKVDSNYTIEGTKKGVNRYTTAKTKELLAKMIKAENHRAEIIKDFNRRVFEKFSCWHEEWDQVARCLAMLDTLCSLAKYARTYSHDICLPTMLPFTDKPFIKIKNGRHPCIPKIDDYVPNDTELGTDGKPAILILTGPNMGGKSTLMRQVALIIVMAQIGSYIPATSCEISLIDRIFTRLGAQDDIISGQSTFFVEVSEASAILQHATKQSFVLLDELGRGTSTHDGNAIATAYMKKLLEIDCRVIYSTHYHTLVEHYGGRTDIQLGHMAYIIQDDEESGEQGVTFLYKLEPGVCSNSYGFNVAKLAGLPENIIKNALEIASKLESSTVHRQLFVQLLTTNNTSTIKQAIASLKSLETV